jgi:hypothetical protein
MHRCSIKGKLHSRNGVVLLQINVVGDCFALLYSSLLSQPQALHKINFIKTRLEVFRVKNAGEKADGRT